MKRFVFNRQAGVIFSLLLAVLVSPTRNPSASGYSLLNHRVDTSFYAVLGPEAPPILHVLIGDSRVLVVQPETLQAAIQQHRIQAFILPRDWADDGDLKAAQAARIPIVYLQRHISVAAIEANIRLLSALTDTQQAGQRWLRTIDDGLARVQHGTHSEKVRRVLILTPEGYTQGQGTLTTDLLPYAGGLNVAAQAGIPEARQLDDAQIRQFKPDVVLLLGWTPQAAMALTLNPVYRGIAAFDQDRVYQIAPLGKDPLSLVQDTEKLANLIHPLAF